MSDRSATDEAVRLPGIDALRYAMAFPVVVIHALPDPQVSLAQDLAHITCLGAVPYFFVASGNFLGRRAEAWPEAFLRPVRRLLPLHLFWMAAYYVALKAYPVQDWEFSPSHLLYGGVAYHLWFLPALCFGLVVVGLGRAVVGLRLTAMAAAALALVGLAKGGYHDLLHLGGTPVRGGVLVAPAFICVGALLAERHVTLGWRALLGMVLACHALLLGETWLVGAASGAEALPAHDFMLSSFPLGAAILLLGRALPDAAPIRRVADLGRISLGVYAAHLWSVWLLAPLTGRGSFWQIVLLALGAFALATGLSLLLSQFPGLKRFVA
ncbi:acyltransferase family protein [Falsiroseomonas sp. HW251]|uniref:acyltransferase family protein n=1 Tax=Falsiroseomonas sp. HW251 TaxID=3390998 RepID=UPI003D31485F